MKSMLIETDTPIIHRLWQPEQYPPNQTVVLIQGRRGNEDVMSIFRQTLPENSLVISLRALHSDPDGGYSWYLPHIPNQWPTFDRLQTALLATHTLLTELPQRYGADPKRIYLMGFSQGAALALTLATFYPHLIQGVASLVGFLPLSIDNSIPNLTNMPIFMANGTLDPTIPINLAQAAKQRLQSSGADLDYYEYPTEHRINAQGMRDLKNWWHAII